MITAALAGISGTLRERSHNLQTEPSDPSLCRQLIEIWQGALQRIERPPVIIELDRQLTKIKGESYLDLAQRGSSVAMLDHVGEQLFQDD